MKYQTVNGQWPATMPALTEQEAISAARRLYRFGMKKKWPYPIAMDRKMRGRSVSFRVDNSRPVMTINTRKGWHGLVHSMSHRCHERLNGRTKNYSAHDFRHAWIEREMIKHVVGSGWLDGRLRREPKPKPQRDPAQERRARTQAAIERWERKAKRAENALRKLRRRQAYYERTTAAAI